MGATASGSRSAAVSQSLVWGEKRNKHFNLTLLLPLVSPSWCFPTGSQRSREPGWCGPTRVWVGWRWVRLDPWGKQNTQYQMHIRTWRCRLSHSGNPLYHSGLLVALAFWYYHSLAIWYNCDTAHIMRPGCKYPLGNVSDSKDYEFCEGEFKGRCPSLMNKQRIRSRWARRTIQATTQHVKGTFIYFRSSPRCFWYAGWEWPAMWLPAKGRTPSLDASCGFWEPWKEGVKLYCALT